MELCLHIGLIVLGLLLLVAGGEALLRGAVALATRARLTPAVIGLTVVAAGTSIPELAVSAVAAVSFDEQAVGCHAFLNRARRHDELIRGYELLKQIVDGYSAVTVLPFDAPAASAFDGLSGLGMVTMDRRIAATALSRGLTLLPRSRSDFTAVPG